MSKRYAIHVSYGGPSYEIDSGGKRWFFEWNHYGGPTVLNRKTEDPIVTQPAENSSFWDAVQWWDQQGRRLKDGLCVWNRHCEPVFEEEQIGPRSVLLGALIRGECCELTTEGG